MATYSSASNQKLTTDSAPLFNNVTAKMVVVVTAGGTTTLTASNPNGVVFTGSTTQTLVLPVVSTLTLGTTYRVFNKSSGAVTVQSSGLNTIQVMAADTSILLTCVAITGTGTSSWQPLYVPTTPFTFPLSPALGGTGVANDAASTQEIVGAYGITWNLTGTTDVTLPESGVLANQLQVQSSAFNVGLDTGTADAYIVDLDPVVGALTDCMLISFTPLNDNATNAPTLTVNGITKNIVNQSGISVSINDITGFTPAYLMYSESQDYWMLLNANVSNVQATFLQNASYYNGTDSGSANAYDVTLDFGGGAGLFSPSPGSSVFFTPANTNTTLSTLTVNGQGPTNIITMDGSSLPAGALKTTKAAWVVFGNNQAGTQGWILINPQGGSNRNGGLVAVSVSGTSQAMTAGHCYIFNNAGATTGTLPTSASSAIGDTIKIKGRSSAAFIIQANTSQIITYGATQSTSAGTATSAAGSDSIQLVYVAANKWSVDFSVSSGFVLA